jgi:formate hydrogenlyase transcriptional activator
MAHWLPVTDSTAIDRHQVRDERDRLRVLLDVTNLLVTQHDLGELLRALSGCIGGLVEHEYASLSLVDGAPDRLRTYLTVLDGRRVPGLEDRAYQISPDSARGLADGVPVIFDMSFIERNNPLVAQVLGPERLRWFCSVALRTARSDIGVLSVASRRERPFEPEAVELIVTVSGQIAIAVENALAYQEIVQLKERLAVENVYLEDELRESHGFIGIVGESPALRHVLRQVERVAGTDSTVLLLGETGTGKELVARALHDRSARHGRPFVRVNSAAIPAALVESELFGHERGAFTGAHAPRVGRLEIADRGTLFLDEIGDLPLDVQPKMLRALQEGEFERIGSSRTQRVNVRVIAATNRDLPAMVEAGRFRSDLFYRLNVFPIELPPLRDRRDDIPLLVRHLVARHAQRLKRPVHTIPTSVMKALTQWDWPGNIRELDNVLERAVILSDNGALPTTIPGMTRRVTLAAGLTRLAEIERAAIMSALRSSSGVVSGPSGAAARLGLKRTTLQSRMRKLGIRRPSF